MRVSNRVLACTVFTLGTYGAAIADDIATTKGKPSLAQIATEDDASVFIGAYGFTAESCPMFEDGEVNRAYIRVENDYLGKNRELSINFYGDEAAIDVVKIGQGSGKLLGTIPDVHGVVTESWVATMDSPLKMKVDTTIERPSIKLVIKGVQTLEIDDKGALTYTRVQTDLDFASCTMYPELTKQQKTAACSDIVSELSDVVTIDAKACLKSGEFKVTENDEGQWWFAYNATNLAGKKVSCEFGMDKPVGKFAPALEDCKVENIK